MPQQLEVVTQASQGRSCELPVQFSQRQRLVGREDLENGSLPLTQIVADSRFGGRYRLGRKQTSSVPTVS